MYVDFLKCAFLFFADDSFNKAPTTFYNLNLKDDNLKPSIGYYLSPQ